uniref:Uncharacterized protein n=1 Tax=Arundo donax TaxID=35708 RepID=A0A0A9AL28_ARUDO
MHCTLCLRVLHCHLPEMSTKEREQEMLNGSNFKMKDTLFREKSKKR